MFVKDTGKKNLGLCLCLQVLRHGHAKGKCHAADLTASISVALAHGASATTHIATVSCHCVLPKRLVMFFIFNLSFEIIL